MKKFDQFQRHLSVLEKSKDQDLENEFIISGIIDKFFIQFELGWKTLKEFLAYEGIGTARTVSPRQIVKEVYRIYGFLYESAWLEMLSARNDMAHLYDEYAAKILMHKVISEFVPVFQQMRNGLFARYRECGNVETWRCIKNAFC